MARTGTDPGPSMPGRGGAGILSSDQFAARLGLYRQTVTDLAAAHLWPPGVAAKVGQQWLFNFPVFYRALAGEGVPAGEIVKAPQLAHLLGLDAQTVRRLAAAGGLPGLQIGKQWLFAVPAVWRHLGWPLDEDGGAPPAPARPPARGRRGGVAANPAALDVADVPLAPGPGRRAGRRRPEARNPRRGQGRSAAAG